MTDSTTLCVQCGQRNSIHRLWCQQCGTPVPCRRAPPAANDAAENARAQLYERVIQDLETQLNARNVSPQTYEAIKTFYQDQLAQIDGQAAERKRLQGLHQLLLSARHAAYSGRFHDAIGLLQQGLSDDRGEYQLHQLIADVNDKIERREKLLQASREADALFLESKASIAALRLAEAEDKLVQAQQLVPGDKRIISALSQVRSQLAEQQARKLAEQKARKLAEQMARKLAEQKARRLAEQTPAIDDGEESRVAKLVEEPDRTAVNLAAASVQQAASEVQPASRPAEPIQPSPAEPSPAEPSLAQASFAADQEEVPSPRHRLIESASPWSSIVKPFLLDNFGWFVGAFLVVAGFIVLIATFWGEIEQNPILIHSFVYVSLAVATGMFFAAAYFIRLKYPQLENSSNVLLVIVALLIPLLFVAALLTSFIPVTPSDVAFLQNPG